MANKELGTFVAAEDKRTPNKARFQLDAAEKVSGVLYIDKKEVPAGARLEVTVTMVTD